MNLSECLFSDLKQLEILLIGKNKLKSIENIVSASLLTLNLDNNEIEIIKISTFRKSDNLKILSLKNNKIKQVQDKAFLNLKNLIEINLENNKITELSADFLDGLSLDETISNFEVLNLKKIKF